MFGKIFKILAGIASVIPVVKDLWYQVKKDVPRVPCDDCSGTGKKPGTTENCPKCNGTGKIRSTELKKNQ